MKVKKILQIIPDLDLAGAETMCENLTNELAKHYKIAIISFFTKKTDITKRLEKNNIKIYYLNKNKGLDLKIIFKIKNIINDYNPDIIHTHRYSLEYVYLARKLSKYKNTKIVHTVHNIASKEIPKIRRYFRKIFIRQNKVIYVAISDIVRDTISNEYNIDISNIPVVLNGINLNNCKEKKSYINTNYIINIGRLTEQKNQLFLINVFNEVHKKNKNYKLKIIGSGPLEEELYSLIKKYNLEESVIHEKNKSSCFNDLYESDIFVMTSKWEGIPMTIIEAMGTGLPVISSNVGGIPNMIKNMSEGILLDLNQQLFINKINELIDDKNAREYFGKNALKKSKCFSSDFMAKEYIKIYEKR